MERKTCIVCSVVLPLKFEPLFALTLVELSFYLDERDKDHLWDYNVAWYFTTTCERRSVFYFIYLFTLFFASFFRCQLLSSPIYFDLSKGFLGGRIVAFIWCRHKLVFMHVLFVWLQVWYRCRILYWHVHYFGSTLSAVVRALAFHQCDPGSIPGLGVICGLSLLVLYSAPKGFSPGTPVFPSLQKPTFDLIWEL